MPNDSRTESGPPGSLHPAGSALRCEAWECRACGKGAPCRVEITYEPTPYPHVEAQDRFRNNHCLCNEPGVMTAWKRMPNEKLTDHHPR